MKEGECSYSVNREVCIGAPGMVGYRKVGHTGLGVMGQA